mgnify:FL=1
MDSKEWKYLIPNEKIPKGYQELKEFFVRKNDVYLNNPEWFEFKDKAVWEVRKEKFEKEKAQKLLKEHTEKTKGTCEFFDNIKIKDGKIEKEEIVETEITNPLFDYGNKITPAYYIERFGDVLPSYYYDVMSAVDNNEVHNYMGMTTKELKNYRKKCDKKNDIKKGLKGNPKKKRGKKKKQPMFSRIIPKEPIVVKFE